MGMRDLTAQNAKNPLLREMKTNQTRIETEMTCLSEKHTAYPIHLIFETVAYLDLRLA